MASAVDYWDAHFAARTPTPRPAPHVVALGRALTPGARVLDVGCGDGANAIPLAQLGHQVDALDFSSEGLVRCGELARAHGVDARVHTIHADMAAHDYPVAHYDLIIAVGSLQNVAGVDSIAHVISRLKAATRPGGHHYFLIMAGVRSLSRRQADALTDAEMRAAWARGTRKVKPLDTPERAAAVRVVMSEYCDPAWEVEVFDVPPDARLFAFGPAELRCAHFVELVARRV